MRQVIIVSMVLILPSNRTATDCLQFVHLQKSTELLGFVAFWLSNVSISVEVNMFHPLTNTLTIVLRCHLKLNRLNNRKQETTQQKITILQTNPKCSMHGIFTYIYHKINQMQVNIPYMEHVGMCAFLDPCQPRRSIETYFWLWMNDSHKHAEIHNESCN